MWDHERQNDDKTTERQERECTVQGAQDKRGMRARCPQQHKKQELEVCVADTGQAGKIKGRQLCKASSHSKLRVT